MDVWVVSYYDAGEEPTVTVFNNKESAEKCYSFFLGQHTHVSIDEVPVYKSFLTRGE